MITYVSGKLVEKKPTEAVVEEHGLGYQVVGEGVERQEQFEVLRAIGCDAVQGYVFAEALLEQDFLKWVRSRAKRLQTVSA